MKFKNVQGNILITEITSEELLVFLKFQIPAKLVFFDKSGNQSKEEISLINRDYINNKKTIEIDYNGNSDIISYDEILNLINSIIGKGLICNIMVEIPIFKIKEPLLMLIGSVNLGIVNDCVYIDYDDDTFELKSPDLPNGDSNKLYYFELNDTILGFDKNGPKLITDNTNINSIEDILN